MYANYGGRARRKEYWMFLLFHLLILLVLGAVDIALQYANDNYYLMPIYVVLTVVPHSAVIVRRLHDIGKSAWWLLLAIVPTVLSWLVLLVITSPFSLGEATAPETVSPLEMLVRIIPAIGGIWLLVFMLMDGQWDANQYGEDPKKLEEIELKESATPYANYERYKNNLISFSIIMGVINVLLFTLFRSMAYSGVIDYLSFKPLSFFSGLLFGIMPILLCLLIKKPMLRNVLIILAVIESVLSLYGTFGIMN
jgi:uncharacterized membrane protein YhaH (DUF805 family)